MLCSKSFFSNVPLSIVSFCLHSSLLSKYYMKNSINNSWVQIVHHSGYCGETLGRSAPPSPGCGSSTTWCPYWWWPSSRFRDQLDRASVFVCTVVLARCVHTSLLPALQRAIQRCIVGPCLEREKGKKKDWSSGAVSLLPSYSEVSCVFIYEAFLSSVWKQSQSMTVPKGRLWC